MCLSCHSASTRWYRHLHVPGLSCVDEETAVCVPVRHWHCFDVQACPCEHYIPTPLFGVTALLVVHLRVPVLPHVCTTAKSQCTVVWHTCLCTCCVSVPTPGITKWAFLYFFPVAQDGYLEKYVYMFMCLPSPSNAKW